jgi:hypothetical protein
VEDGKVIGVTLLATAAEVGTALVFSVGDVSAGTGPDADAMGCAGASRRRNSFAPKRLSFQGKFRPGSPNVWPPKVMLNSSAWTSRESDSAVFNRQGSR